MYVHGKIGARKYDPQHRGEPLTMSLTLDILQQKNQDYALPD